MGNVQIKDRPRKTQSIFKDRRKSVIRSPFKAVVSPQSPHYQDFSPIRYSQPQQLPRPEARFVSPNFHPPIQEVHPSPTRVHFVQAHPPASGRREAQWRGQNRHKCEEIIKKVRNFNDFLLQLKRKLRQDCLEQGQERALKREMNLSVRLDNERLELEKYKKLVKRQLSKTHSISSIDIQHLKNGEKMLRIEYEDNLIQQASQVPSQPDPFDDRTQYQHSELNKYLKQSASMFHPKLPKQTVIDKSIHKKTSLGALKAHFQSLKQICTNLGQQLAEQESIQTSHVSESLSAEQALTLKLQNILEGLTAANQDSQDVQRQLRTLIL